MIQLFGSILDDELNNLMETMFLFSIPNYIDIVNDIRENENLDEASIYIIDEEW